MISIYDQMTPDLSLIERPAREPLDLEWVKQQRRFDLNQVLDSAFDHWISAARELFEQWTGRQLITAVYDVRLDGAPWGPCLELPRPPLQAVLGVFYEGTDGSEVEVDASNYRVIAPARYNAPPGRIELRSGASWPTVGNASPLRIRFRAGYGDVPAAVYELDKQALLWLVGHFHKFGEEVIQGTILTQLPIGVQALVREAAGTALPLNKPRQSWASTAWPV